MSKDNTLSLLSVSGTLDVTDVLSIVTSRAETTYKRKLTAARTVVKDAETVVKDTKSEIARLAEREAKAAEADKVEALRTAVEALGGHVTVSVRNSWNQHRERLDLENGQLVVGRASISSNSNSYNPDFKIRVEPSKTLVAKIESLDAAKEDLQKAQGEALEWQKKLSSIPSLERQYRAKLAEAKLQESEDGQAVLDLLQKDLDETLLDLPTV